MSYVERVLSKEAFKKSSREKHEAIRVTRADYDTKMACDLAHGDIILLGNEEYKVVFLAYGGYCGKESQFYEDFPLYDIYLEFVKGPKDPGEYDRKILFCQPGCYLFMVVGHEDACEQEE